MNDAPFIDRAAFERMRVEGDTAVVAFVASWNRRCQAFAADYVDLARAQQGRTPVVRVDVDDCPELAGSLDITSVPTLVVLRQGREIYREATVDLAELRLRIGC